MKTSNLARVTDLVANRAALVGQLDRFRAIPRDIAPNGHVLVRWENPDQSAPSHLASQVFGILMPIDCKPGTTTLAAIGDHIATQVEAVDRELRKLGVEPDA